MNARRFVTASVLAVGLLANAAAASAQTGPLPEPTARGTVVSSTDNTLLIRSGEGEYALFVLDRETIRPLEIPVRSEVAIAYAPSTDGWAPAANVVRITGQAQTQGLAPPPQDEAVPPALRNLERDVERQARRYRIGIRGGSALDPELVMLGVHSQIGPFFTENIWARPNIELGFGEVTTLVALNFDGAYRLPITPARGRWMVYAGGGPSLNFSKFGFNPEDVVGDVDAVDRFDFDDLDLDMGFSFMLGMQSRGGTFFELRSTAYSRPRLRFQVGRTF